MKQFQSGRFRMVSGLAALTAAGPILAKNGMTLRPCPFCTAQEQVFDRDENAIICARCSAEGPRSNRKGDLVTAAMGWNGEAFEEAPSFECASF